MSVRTYLVRRFALLLLVLVGISLVTFLLVRVVPSDPAADYVGPRARPEQIEEARHILGLNRPLYLQYAIYVGDLVRGDWGTSIRTRRPVLGDILTFLPLSLELVITTLALSISVGVLLGALTAHMKGRWVDHVMRVFAIGGVSVPSFVLAILSDPLLPNTRTAAGLGRARRCRLPDPPRHPYHRHDGGRRPD